ncbi:MAG TPA: DEAD/DEAH box helicase [Euryarchaeota archaeon]|nr:putative DEAD-box ATP-dependent RNA helicase [archaeon BMS3Bbin15]HDL15545.1 DEAD/DEAH box helicase [Euryarchaeota archaeon]
MYKCPGCGSEILIYKSKKGFSLICLNCRTGGEIETESEEKAYLQFLQEYKNGNFIPESQKDIKKELEASNITLNELPEALRKIYLIKGISVVKYRLFREENLEEGKRPEELELHPKLRNYLSHNGIERLYKFQELALNYVSEGKDILIEAPTGSGKTEAFTLPVVDNILNMNKRGVHALFLYPTKALTRDQADKFMALEKATGIKFRVFDGDTSQEEREKIFRDRPEVILTNPDLLHYHLTMPWSRFRHMIRNIQFLVIDEVHSYTGAFGTHLHFLIKRLKRFTGLQIIGSSATIGNPEEFSTMLFSSPVKVIRVSVGRKGRLHFAMLYPGERSNISASVEALRILQMYSYKTLAFSNTHRNAEFLLRAARKGGLNVDLHRAGLSLKKRQGVERRFKAGKIGAVVATPTLELGIDIGSVNAVVSNLVDFTRLLQRLGRAGRKGQESIALLFLNNNDPISSYFKNHPEDYFTELRPCYIEPKNEVIGAFQLLSASFDKPLREDEFPELFGVRKKLLGERKLIRKGKYIIPSQEAGKEIRESGIRGMGKRVFIKFKGRVIGERGLPMALRELHQGAVYFHSGEAYRSSMLHLSSGESYAEVEKLHEEIKTEALHYSVPEVLEVIERKQAFGMELNYAKLKITDVVRGYVEKEFYSDKKLKEVDLSDKLSFSFSTYGFFFRAPEPEIEGSEEEKVAGSFHALEHVLIEGSNTLLGGGSDEIGGISLGTTGMIFIYDASPGGNGLSRLLYSRFEKAVLRSRSILEECACQRDDGCPRCTYSYHCGNNNKPLLKAGALSSLEKIASGRRTWAGEIKLDKGYV